MTDKNVTQVADRLMAAVPELDRDAAVMLALATQHALKCEEFRIDYGTKGVEWLARGAVILTDV